jgi:hypothetical protein
VSPVLRALREEVALPVSEVGPWDRAPLRRLAAAWAAEAMGVSLKKKWLREQITGGKTAGATTTTSLSQPYGSMKAQEKRL